MSWKFMIDRANSKYLPETSQPHSCNNFSNVNNSITCMIIWTRNKQPVLLKGTTDVELWNPSVNSSGHPLGPVILKPQRRRRWGSLCKTDLEIAGIFSFFEIGQQVDIVVHPQSGESRHPFSEIGRCWESNRMLQGLLWKERQQTKLHASGKSFKNYHIFASSAIPPLKRVAFTDPVLMTPFIRIFPGSRTCDVRKSPGHFDGDCGHSDHHPELLESRGNLNLDFLQDGPLLVINGD